MNLGAVEKVFLTAKCAKVYAKCTKTKLCYLDLCAQIAIGICVISLRPWSLPRSKYRGLKDIDFFNTPKRGKNGRGAKTCSGSTCGRETKNGTMLANVRLTA